MASDSVQSRRESQKLRRAWCCSFTSLPKSPENIKQNQSQQPHHKAQSLSSSYSFPNSPQINHKTNLTRVTRMDPRRILSPGRVSPIDSDPVTVTDPTEPAVTVEPVSVRPVQEAVVKSDVYDVRLSLKGRNGECSVLEVDSEVLSACSSVFKRLIEECKKREGGDGGGGGLCRIEVPDVQNLSVFHETIEIMFDDEDVSRRMRRMGVSRAIDVLEVAAGIMFTKGVLSCLKYIEAVPWSESEEDKLRSLFTKFTFDDATTRDVLARLSLPEQINSQQHLALQLVRSVTSSGNDKNSRSELKSLVKDLFAKSSVYEKDLSGLDKEALYVICQSCLDSLVALFEEASESVPEERSKKTGTTKPLIERISREADSINWLLGILLDQQMAEEFVDIWADQEGLLRMHEKASPMVRYELSRISAWVFIALGKGKLHCRSETRCRIFQSWFTPMLADFGWLQRCKKGLDIKVLEEAMGQALLTLPMKNQHLLFMEWFRCFSRQGTECPNLGKAFQIWWRRSSKSSGTLSLDSR